jgi:HEAT repeat protein
MFGVPLDAEARPTQRRRIALRAVGDGGDGIRGASRGYYRRVIARSAFGSTLSVGILFCRFVTAGGVSTTPAVTHASGGQSPLAVGFDATGNLRAHVCQREPCSLDGASAIPVPEEAMRLAMGARLRVLRLGLERTGVVVEIPDPPKARTWFAVVVAPLKGAEPLVPFSGYTGLVEGVEGERSGPTVVVRDEGVYVGVTREDRDLCGRPALLSPRVLDPATLTFLPAKLQQLSEAARGAAPRLGVQRTEGAAPPSLLRAVWATSVAEGSRASALSDGNPETAWAEGRSGVGRGEAVVMLAPREVPLAAIEIALPAPRDRSRDGAPRKSETPTTSAEKGAPNKSEAAVAGESVVPPREFWLATDHELFHVTLPDEAARTLGSRYTIALPAPVRTGCVALVLESAASDRRDVKVGLGELWAQPTFAGTTDELVQRISKGGPEADAAAGILRSSGPAALGAVASAFDGLHGEGRLEALDILDEAPCDVALPAYVTALESPVEAERAHARSALPRCGPAGPIAIAHAIEKGGVATRLELADELVGIAPAAAVDALVPLLAAGREKERRAYRIAIGRGAQSAEGQEALRRALERPDLSANVTIDLLRAAGESLAAFGDVARRAFSRVTTDQAAFRARFLLLGPAAELSEEDGGARAFLRRALTLDKSPYVRAEAARVLRVPKPFYAELSRAADDPDVRVREAAVVSLGMGRIDGASDRLVYRLERDPWPMVRAAAARSLAALGASSAVDTALRRVITEDESPEVRRGAVLAVGARHVTAAASTVRDRLQDRQELDSVRTAAALSLGLMCDAASADALTEQALRLVSPTADETDRRVAESALSGLALLHPPDLAKRISTLTAKTTPGPMRRLGTAALAAKGHCGALPRPPDARR